MTLEERRKAARRRDRTTSLAFEIPCSFDPRLDCFLEGLAPRIQRAKISHRPTSREVLYDVMHHREWKRRCIPDGAGRSREPSLDHEDPYPVAINIMAAGEHTTFHVGRSRLGQENAGELGEAFGSLVGDRKG